MDRDLDESDREIEDAMGGEDTTDEPDLREQEAEEADGISIPAAPPPAH